MVIATSYLTDSKTESDRGREVQLGWTPLPPNRTGVFPHTALQLVVARMGLGETCFAIVAKFSLEWASRRDAANSHEEETKIAVAQTEAVKEMNSKIVIRVEIA